MLLPRALQSAISNRPDLATNTLVKQSGMLVPIIVRDERRKLREGENGKVLKRNGMEQNGRKRENEKRTHGEESESHNGVPLFCAQTNRTAKLQKK
jgi:hypothetical protein